MPAVTAGEQQIDLPLAGLAPGEYVVEIKATAKAAKRRNFSVSA